MGDHPLLDDSPELGHETTRVLGAAVHRDPALAEQLVDEFLTEPKRCIAWSRGLDNVAVLTDAVASVRRAQVRDAFLVVFAVVVLGTRPFLALGWLAVALLAAGWGAGADDGLAAAGVDRRETSARRGRRAARALLLTALVVAGALLVTNALGMTAISAAVVLTLGLGGPAGGYLAALAILVVLVLDVVVTTRLLVTAFGRRSFCPDPHAPEVSPWRRVGWRTFRYALGRVRAAEALLDDQADVVVFRRDLPFCGAGRPLRSREFAMTLYHADTEEEVTPTGLDRELHQAVRVAMNELRGSPSLSPNHRFGGLRRREQLTVPSEELVRHSTDPALAGLLPRGLDGPPLRHVDLDEARRGIEEPHEWARFYQHFSLEAWDRDLVVSWFFTLATDRQYLYLQWTPCVLLPLPPAVRDDLDGRRRLLRRARRDVITRSLTFPVTLPARLRRATRRFRPRCIPRGAAAPAQFGAAGSVREMAAEYLGGDPAPRRPLAGQWFQRSDARRYAILVDRVLIEAVRRCLTEHGLSLTEFDQVAQTIVNNFSGISGSVIAAGDGATAVGTMMPGSLDSGGAP